MCEGRSRERPALTGLGTLPDQSSMVELVELELEELELEELELDELDEELEVDDPSTVLDVLDPPVVVVDVGGGTLGVSPRARPTKVAICPRVTASSGQNKSLTGGLHPIVTPATARRSMSPSKIEESSSENRSPEPGSV